MKVKRSMLRGTLQPILRAVVPALAVLAVLTGCDRKGGSATTAPSAPPAEVRLGYFANVTHAQAVLGSASGDFERAVAPAKFSTKVFNAGPSLIEALLGGQIDIGYVGPGPALNGFTVSHGEQLRVISGSAADGVLIVARKDSGIASIQDLKDKRIATPQRGNTQDISARHYLLAELKQPNADNVLPIANAEQAGMMSRGQIDASWAPEPWGSYLVAETGATVVAQERDLWPEKSFAITVIVTTPDFLAKHPDVVEKLLAVHLDWTDRLSANPTSVQPQLEKALFALTNKKLPAGVLTSALGNTKFTEDPLEPTFTKFAKWSDGLGFSKRTKTEGLIDTTLVRKVRAAHPATSHPTTAPTASAGVEVR